MNPTHYGDSADVFAAEVDQLLERPRMAQTSEAPQMMRRAALLLQGYGQVIDQLRARVSDLENRHE